MSIVKTAILAKQWNRKASVAISRYNCLKCKWKIFVARVPCDETMEFINARRGRKLQDPIFVVAKQE